MSSVSLTAANHSSHAERHPVSPNVEALRVASRSLQESRDQRSRLQPKQLVSLLLSHGARAWRNAQPVAHTRLVARGADGMPSVRLRFANRQGAIARTN